MSSNTHTPKLSDDVINQIKDFNHYESLTEEQKSLIDELFPNEELKERYKKYGLCYECRQPNIGPLWCQSCYSQHFQHDFDKWTSGNKEIDENVGSNKIGTTEDQYLVVYIH